MDLENLSKDDLLKVALNMKKEIEYLKHLNSEMDLTGFQLNSMLYQVMLNNLPFMAWLKDSTGRFIAVNKFFENTYNLDNDEIINKTDFDILPYELAKRFSEEDYIVIQTKTSKVIIAHDEKNEKTFWHETYKSPILNSDGSVIALLGISRDITNQFDLQVKLSESEKHIQNISEQLTVGIYRTDIDGNFIHSNSLFSKILGFKSQEYLKSKNASDFFLDSNLRNIQIERLKNGEIVESVYEIVNIEGNHLFIRDTGKMSFDESNQKFYIDGFIEDITEKKKSVDSISDELMFYRTIYYDLPICSLITDSYGQIIITNKEFINNFGFDENELIGKNINSILPHNFEYFRDLNLYFESLKTNEKKVYDTCILDKSDGNRMVRMEILKSNYDTNSHIIFYFYQYANSRIYDDNDVKQIVERYNLLVENSFDGIYIISNNGYEYVNNQFCEITGYSIDELINENFNFNVLLTPDSKKLMDVRFEARLKGLPISDFYEITIISKDGILKDLEVITKDIGTPGELRIQGIMRDVTQRKLNHRKIEENSLKFKLLAENIPGVVYLCNNDEHYSVIYINDRILDLVGHSRTDFIEGKVNFTDFYHKDDYQKIFKTVDEAIKNRSSYHIIFRIRDIKGNYRWIEEYGSGVFYEDELLYLEGILFDITERINLQNELESLNLELEKRVVERTLELDNTLDQLRREYNEKAIISNELSKAKDELTNLLFREKELSNLKSRFISMVSHEYRTPLTVILTSTYLLDRYFASGQADLFKENIKRIQNSVQNITKMLEEVLLIGQDDLGIKLLKPSRIDLISVLSEIKNDILINHPDKKQQIIINKNLENPELFTDMTAFRHIFTNLISNAVKYSINRTDVIIDINENDSEITIRVIDSGIGIPENDFESLFEPFHRASNVGTLPGTGLGLTVVKRSIDMINAKLSFESKLNHGSEFIVAFRK